MSRNLAIIPARGGSKRIPKKNIKQFCGKPIIAYSIEAALESGLFDEVMVSTDSEEIAGIATRYGAQVPFMRSNEASNDYATTAEVLKEVIQKYGQIGKEFDYMCCLYPAAPFITKEHLSEGMHILKEKNAIEVRPVVKFSYPPQRCLIIKDECLIMKWEKYMKARSQDLEPVYHDAGQFYCMDIKKFMERDGIYNENIYPLILSELEVQDIDTEDDWKMAEIKYKMLR
ncbi:MAG: pseudaminic acid cytidylyltransferase [Lachnospiraceae bacterium]|nr:pseudaminic acid cytidylyltransferase [Lachnospiraceae bacterium]